MLSVTQIQPAVTNTAGQPLKLKPSSDTQDTDGIFDKSGTEVTSNDKTLPPETEKKLKDITADTEKKTLPADGKDDGSISFKDKIKNIGKGIGNFFKSIVCDEEGNFSWGQTAKSVLLAAGFFVISALSPGAAVGIAIGALGLGTFDLLKSVKDVISAKTDAEAEQAWQNIGSSGTEELIAIIGVKSTSALSKAKGILKGAKGGPISPELEAELLTEPSISDISKKSNIVDGIMDNLTNAANGHKDAKAAYKGSQRVLGAVGSALGLSIGSRFNSQKSQSKEKEQTAQEKTQKAA